LAAAEPVFAGCPRPRHSFGSVCFSPSPQTVSVAGISLLVASASQRVDIDRGQLGPEIAMPVPSRRRDEIREFVYELKLRDLHNTARAWLC